MGKNAKRFYPHYFTFPAILIFSVFFVLPILAGFFLSFTDWNINRLFAPVFVGLANFKYLLNDDYFMLALKNTFLFGFITTFLIVAIGLALALVLKKMVFGKSVFRTLFYLPAVLSLIVVGIMFTSIFKMNNGMLNKLLTAIGLQSMTTDWLGNPATALYSVMAVHVWKWSGFAMAIFLAGLHGIPEEYYEAARIDGAGVLSQFKNITFPLLAPAFTVVVTLNTIGGLKVFEQVYVMTGGGPGNTTQVLGTYIYKGFSMGMLGRSTAMGLILFVIVSVIAVVLNWFLRSREVTE